MNSELGTFDIAKYLDNNEVIAEYLSQVLESGDSDEFLSASLYLLRPIFEYSLFLIRSDLLCCYCSDRHSTAEVVE